MARRDALFCLDNDLTCSRLKVKIKLLASQSLSDQIDFCRLREQCDAVVFEEQAQDFFCGVIQGFEHNSRRQFAATVNSDKQEIFLIKLKIQPRPAVRNHPGIEEQLSG